MQLALDSELLATLDEYVKGDRELWVEATTTNLYQAGLLLNSRAANPDEDNFAERDYWNAFLRELRELLCTDNETYKDVRQHIAGVRKTTNQFIVPAIAGAIGATIGVAAAVLVPFVALILAAILRLGVNTWCSINVTQMHETLQETQAPSEQRRVQP